MTYRFLTALAAIILSALLALTGAGHHGADHLAGTTPGDGGMAAKVSRIAYQPASTPPATGLRL